MFCKWRLIDFLSKKFCFLFEAVICFLLCFLCNRIYGKEVLLLQKTKKKYALRKTAAYGLVSCVVGLMLVGSLTQVNAEESKCRRCRCKCN